MFVPQSRAWIFCNDHTRSTPLDPKLMFWRILYYLGVFGTIVCLMKLGAKWAELVQKVRFHEVASKFFATNAPDPPHWTLNSCFGGAVWLAYETWCETSRTCAKFVTRSRVRMFRNERTRSTPLDPKLKFSYVLYYLGAFGTVWLFYETRCKTGRTSAKVRNTKSRLNFS